MSKSTSNSFAKIPLNKMHIQQFPGKVQGPIGPREFYYMTHKVVKTKRLDGMIFFL